jgi:hypothetical protein
MNKTKKQINKDWQIGRILEQVIIISKELVVTFQTILALLKNMNAHMVALIQEL